MIETTVKAKCKPWPTPDFVIIIGPGKVKTSVPLIEADSTIITAMLKAFEAEVWEKVNVPQMVSAN
jgi:hypothetical protein